ncbi:MAG: nucleotidyltransferase family protein, partial [Clostridia bacterium]|nr:nucleotidyltransferase family protein [Clostridia bacterium]
MKICFIVAEFNPLHNGHKFFIDEIRRQGFSHIIAVMSSNFVQRGEPAIFSKEARTEMALENGIDLVIELPTKWSMSTAQRYAFSAMKTANSLGVVDAICFGSECGDINLLDKIAKALGSEEFELYLKKQLLRGLTFAKARQNALEEFFSYEDLDIKNIISKPNNILAIEYLKALHELNSDIKVLTVKRCEKSKNISSASDIRRLLINRSNLYKNYVPEKVAEIIENQNNNFAVLENAEQAIVYSLKNTDRLNFLKVADVSEGIENRILNATDKFKSIKDILSNVKTKRYTMSR